MIVLFASAASAIAASRCPSNRPAKARFRTVAWVSTTCRTDANGTGGRQEGTVVFTANCNPSFDTNPNGDQIFAVRPDGSGLRQLTSLRGVRDLADGSQLVELPGPASYTAPVP
jgi:hypothetical protein